MKFLRVLGRQKKKNRDIRLNDYQQSIEDYGRDQLRKLADKGIGFQVTVL